MKADSGIVRAFIGLGGNLDNPMMRLKLARNEIASAQGIAESKFSSLYRSAPLGPSSQPDYVNAVMAIDTHLDPLSLLDILQAIEIRFGRVRAGERWGPRTLDLDLLVYGDRTIKTERLVVPHPEISEREFVIYPLYEIAPHLEIPTLGSISSLKKKCPNRGLEVIEHV